MVRRLDLRSPFLFKAAGIFVKPLEPMWDKVGQNLRITGAWTSLVFFDDGMM